MGNDEETAHSGGVVYSVIHCGGICMGVWSLVGLGVWCLGSTIGGGSSGLASLGGVYQPMWAGVVCCRVSTAFGRSGGVWCTGMAIGGGGTYCKYRAIK